MYVISGMILPARTSGLSFCRYIYELFDFLCPSRFFVTYEVGGIFYFRIFLDGCADTCCGGVRNTAAAFNDALTTPAIACQPEAPVRTSTFFV